MKDSESTSRTASDAERFSAMLKLLIGFVATVISIGSLANSLQKCIELGFVSKQLVSNLIGLFAGLLLLAFGYTATRSSKAKKAPNSE